MSIELRVREMYKEIEDFAEVKVDSLTDLVSVLAGISKSEAKRLITSGGVQIAKRCRRLQIGDKEMELPDDK